MGLQKQPAQVSEVTVKKAGVKQTNCLVCHCKCSITNKGLVYRHPESAKDACRGSGHRPEYIYHQITE